MDYWWDGAKIGLLLSLLAGPILIALVQTTIERGLRAGALLGLGIWMSDVLFIQLAYYSLAKLQALTSGPWFSTTMGTVGGILLIIFGVVAVWKKSGTSPPSHKSPISASSWLGYWLRGFLINTLNPFTFFFWVGIAGNVVVDGGLAKGQAFSYFSGILSVIVFTDSLKILLAKRIRRYIQEKHLLWMRRIAGSGLLIFGVALLIRVWR
jgi:threonine/homoserine/homoserine lactone efflux protein